MKLWDKDKKGNEHVEDFTVGDDYILDKRLLPYEIQGSIAHARALEQAGILSREEAGKLVEALGELQNRGISISKEQEDVHTAVEQYLTEKLGELGKKIHTGRSRNDQVMVDIQLWCRDEIRAIYSQVIVLCETLSGFSRENHALMPGYTHMQKAMPSSLQLILGSYIESLLDDLLLLETAYRINNRNPLGSAAGYGTTLGLDRELTSKLLGFDGSRNCIYVQARAKHLSTILFPLTSIMKSLERIASDLLLFTMDEFRFFSLPDELCTGSSIMPQKKNYDILELVRAKSSVVHAFAHSVEMIGSKLISGYNRDFQLTKRPLFESVDITRECLRMMSLVFENLEINSATMEKAITAELFATDSAYGLVKGGATFRSAYGEIARSLDKLEVPVDLLTGREHLLHRDYAEEIGLRKNSPLYQ